MVGDGIEAGGEVKSAAGAGSALHPDFALHQGDESGGDDKPEAGTARRSIGWSGGLKDPLPRPGSEGDAGAGVADDEMEGNGGTRVERQRGRAKRNC